MLSAQLRNLLYLVLLLLLTILTACSSEPQDPSGRSFEAKVSRVIDGDTIEIALDQKNNLNTKETVRLLLVDTPETVHPEKPVQPFGKEASDYSKKLLTGKTVQVELDVSDRDSYGRLLAYIWLDGKLFNELLIEQGLARVAYIFPPNVKYVDRFQAVQRKAQEAGIGIWSLENYVQDKGFTDHPQAPSAQSDTSAGDSSVTYASCKEVRAAGNAPLRKGEPGYSPKMDGDGDGIACE
jgi:micrococcal nuclease